MSSESKSKYLSILWNEKITIWPLPKVRYITKFDLRIEKQTQRLSFTLQKTKKLLSIWAEKKNLQLTTQFEVLLRKCHSLAALEPITFELRYYDTKILHDKNLRRICNQNNI